MDGCQKTTSQRSFLNFFFELATILGFFFSSKKIRIFLKIEERLKSWPLKINYEFQWNTQSPESSEFWRTLWIFEKSSRFPEFWIKKFLTRWFFLINFVNNFLSISFQKKRRKQKFLTKIKRFFSLSANKFYKRRKNRPKNLQNEWEAIMLFETHYRKLEVFFHPVIPKKKEENQSFKRIDPLSIKNLQKLPGRIWRFCCFSDI